MKNYRTTKLTTKPTGLSTLKNWIDLTNLQKILKKGKPVPPPIQTLHHQGKTALTTIEKAEMLAETLEERFTEFSDIQDPHIQQEVEDYINKTKDKIPENYPEFTLEELEETL